MPKGRILAVDDQRYFRELLEGMLVEEGFDVQTASDAEEAMRVLERGAFDILLTDLVMPGMDGNELVHRVKSRDPDQDIVVVTGVVDVKTAVDSMKLGASEYLLKPFDRETLSNTLEGVLHRRRLRLEHARLLAENIEYMGERTLIERAIALYSFLSVEPLAERIVDGLCVETGAQGGLLWIADDEGSDQLTLASARGLVRVEEEPETIAVSELSPEFREGADRSLMIGLDSGPIGAGAGLYLVFRDESRISGLVRLTDKLGGERFDAVDRSCAEKFVGFAEIALVNALRFSALERRNLEDASTGAYLYEYFEDAVRNEIEKSTRHGRAFSLLQIEVGPLDGLRRKVGERAFREWNAELVERLSSLQRSSDLLATRGEGNFVGLFPESDALGAAQLKQRATEALETSPLLLTLAPAVRPTAHLAVATFPAEGTQLEGLTRLLADRIEMDRSSPVRELDLENKTLSECLDLLLDRGFDERPESLMKIAAFALREPTRQAAGRSLLFAAPGRLMDGLVADRFCSGSRCAIDTEIAVLSDGERPDGLDGDVNWVGRTPDPHPFVIHFGEGPAYALVCEDAQAGRASRMFHTSDRSLVEHLAFRVQRDLGMETEYACGRQSGG
jgi:diguanylate cyclase (GGDEF)-like protein